MKLFWTFDWSSEILKPLIFPITHTFANNKLQFIASIILIAWVHIATLCLMAIYINDLKNCHSVYCKKVNIAFNLLAITIIGVWCSIIHRRNEVYNMLKEYKIFQQRFKMLFHKFRIIINATTAVFIVCCIIYIIICMKYFITNGSLTKWWIYKIGVSSVMSSDFLVEQIFLFFYMVSTRTVYIFYPGILALYHISLFSSLSIMLSYVNDSVHSMKVCTSTEKFINFYETIHNMATSIESALSLELLFLTLFQYTLVYTVVSDFYEQETDILMYIEKMSFRNIPVLFFIVMVFYESEVNYQDIRLRKNVRGLVFRMTTVENNAKCADVLSRFMDSKDEIAFSAWGMFRFTRTFILTSLSVLITYSILILQLDTADKSNHK